METKNLENLPSLDRILCSNSQLITVNEALKIYASQLRKHGQETGNRVELVHALKIEELLGIIEDNKYIFSAQDDIKKFIVAVGNPNFSYIVYGRIKSILRFENKFNGYVQDACTAYENKSSKFKETHDLETFVVNYLERFRDMVAFRIIVSSKNNNHKSELEELVRITNLIPDYFSSTTLNSIEGQIGTYRLLPASKLIDISQRKSNSLIREENRIYFKNYVENPKKHGYMAFHIAMFNERYRKIIELQTLTFSMLCKNEHDLGSHTLYEENQKNQRLSANLSENQIFSEAHERLVRQNEMDLTKVRIKMFFAATNSTTDVEDYSGLVNGFKLPPTIFS